MIESLNLTKYFDENERNIENTDKMKEYEPYLQFEFLFRRRYKYKYCDGRARDRSRNLNFNSR